LSQELHKQYEEKSKLFLKKIMGDEKFDILQKIGKIDIEIDKKFLGLKTGKIVYELYDSGKVINKTKNQSYCIIPERNDYPKYDILAIKYAWLMHNPKFAEKVANRTSLINSSPGYDDYVDYMLQQGWIRKFTLLDEQNDYVTISGASNSYTTCVAHVRCPAGCKMTLMGKQQIPRGGNIDVAYSLELYITDENGKEIPDDTKIRITKARSSEYVIQLARIYYDDIKMNNKYGAYRFTQGFELQEDDLLEIFVVESKYNISAKNIKVKIETDLWSKYT